MIDASKCKWEDSWDNGAVDGVPEIVHYFIYPKEEGMSEAEFQDEESYCETTIPAGRVVSTCLMLVELGGKPSHMMLSPTVDVCGELEDVDWMDIYPGDNYAEETMFHLLKLAHAERNVGRKS